MNTQQEAVNAINELLSSWHRTSNHQEQLQQIRDNLQSTHPIAADAEILVPVPGQEDGNFRDGKEIKTWMDAWLIGYKTAMKEYASQPKGAGVDWEKLQDSISEIAIEQMNVLEIHKWWDFGDYEEIRGQDSAAFEIGAAVVNYLKSDEFSSLPSQEGQQ